MIRILASRTISEKEKKNEPSQSTKGRIIIFAALFAAGLFLGINIYKHGSSDLMIKLLSIFNNYREVCANQALIINFFNSFFTSFIYLILTYALGLCAVGTPAICAVPLVRGMGIGVISAYMYNVYSLSGLGYCALIIYPGLIISLIIMVMYCSESACMSKDMLMLISFKNDDCSTSLKKYTARYLIFCLMSIIPALTDAVFILLFSRFFFNW